MAIAVNLRNPYIIGRPIDEPDCFFGRENLFEFIEDTLLQGSQVILLHGQRRIGKSSVLSQIPNFVRLDRYVFVPLSLEGKSQKPLNEVLFELGRDVLDQLGLLHQGIVTFPEDEATLRRTADQWAASYWEQLWRSPKLHNKRLVLLLDEFDAVGDVQTDAAIAHLFPYLQQVVQTEKRLFLIPVIGRRLEDLPRLLSLFKGAPAQEVGRLDRRSAERLIRKPAEKTLEYEPTAVDAILKLAAGHPYFTQVICFALFANARQLNRWRVTQADVEGIAERAIEIGEGGLAWFRDGLPIPERVLFSAIAGLQAQHRHQDPIALLQSMGVEQIEVMQAAREQLVKWDFIEEVRVASRWFDKWLGRAPLPPEPKVTVELVCRWLNKRYSLNQEIWELEKLSPEAHGLYKAAIEHPATHLRSQLQRYAQILELNPDHFSALFALADGYLHLAEQSLEVEDFRIAVELLTRSHKIDPLRVRDRLFQALLGYGGELLRSEQSELAKVQFKRASELEQSDPTIQHLMQVIVQAETGFMDERTELKRLREALGIAAKVDRRSAANPLDDLIIPQTQVSFPAVTEAEVIIPKHRTTKPPERVIHGRYRVSELLGTGGLSRTYLVEDLQAANRTCTLKQFKFSEGNDPNFIVRAKLIFFAESEVIKSLGDYDRIPKVLDYFEEDGELYLVQEYIEGKLLSRELRQDKKWSETRVIQLLKDVLEILVFVHSHGVVHRDLKPSNLIRRDRDQQFVLLDFGGAIKQIQTLAISADSSLTLAIGTKGYAPPEQLGRKPSFSSDLYALGMIAIQALTGEHPQQLQDEADPNTGEIVWRDRAEVSDRLAEILSKMVRYSFRERYQSAEEVLADLHKDLYA